MTGATAQFAFASSGDVAELAAFSASLWAELGLDTDARAALRRDGIDPASLRLTGPHPYLYAPAPERAVAVTACAATKTEAEALLDLFRIYFLRRLCAEGRPPAARDLRQAGVAAAAPCTR